MKTTGNSDMREEMTEAEEAAFDAAAADPSLITTAEQGREIMEGLEDDIDAIKEQLEAAKLEAEVCGLTDDRQAWVRRATSALVWKKRQQKAVRDRLRELCPPAPAPKHDPEIAAIVRNVAVRHQHKSMRLLEEEAIRIRKAEEAEAKLRNVHASTARTVSQSTMFVAAARTIISKEQNAQVWALAREMFPDSPAWLPLSADGAAT